MSSTSAYAPLHHFHFHLKQAHLPEDVMLPRAVDEALRMPIPSLHTFQLEHEAVEQWERYERAKAAELLEKQEAEAKAQAQAEAEAQAKAQEEAEAKAEAEALAQVKKAQEEAEAEARAQATMAQHESDAQAQLEALALALALAQAEVEAQAHLTHGDDATSSSETAQNSGAAGSTGPQRTPAGATVPTQGRLLEAAARAIQAMEDGEQAPPSMPQVPSSLRLVPPTVVPPISAGRSNGAPPSYSEANPFNDPLPPSPPLPARPARATGDTFPAEHLGLVDQMRQVTQADDAVCRRLLKDSNFDINTAIGAFFSEAS